jgi:hypothetical protein
MIVLTASEKLKLAALVEKLNAIEADTLEEAGPEMLKALTGFPGCLWQVLDDRIGNARETGLKRPYLLRQMRNTPKWGSQMFKVLA